MEILTMIKCKGCNKELHNRVEICIINDSCYCNQCYDDRMNY